MILAPLPRAGRPGPVRTADQPNTPDPNRPFSILAVSGGGTSVLASALALADMETHLGWPLRRRFDLLSGASAGAILILAVAAGIPMAAFANAWSEGIGGIFSQTPAPKTRRATLMALAASLVRSRHDGLALRTWLAHAWPDSVRVANLPTRILVPAVDLTEGRARALRSNHAPGRAHVADWMVRDVALASSAAPVFLPIHRAHGSAWADGGLFANAPDTMALMEAIGPLQVPLERVHMLSMGTSWRMERVDGNGPPLAWGVKDWARNQRILKTGMYAQQGMAVEHAAHALGPRHWRLEARPSAKASEDLALDAADATARATLHAMGTSLWANVRTSPAVTFLEGHKAARAVFGAT